MNLKANWKMYDWISNLFCTNRGNDKNVLRKKESFDFSIWILWHSHHNYKGPKKGVDPDWPAIQTKEGRSKWFLPKMGFTLNYGQNFQDNFLWSYWVVLSAVVDSRTSSCFASRKGVALHRIHQSSKWWDASR